MGLRNCTCKNEDELSSADKDDILNDSNRKSKSSKVKDYI
jgi:hypothetical protein